MCLFKDFSLTVQDGEFVSIVGSNGSGKTLPAEHHLRQYSGGCRKIIMHGTDITGMSEYRRHANIGRVPEPVLQAPARA